MNDYSAIDLRDITWHLESIQAADFPAMPTGEADAGFIETYAENPVYWVEIRPPEVGRHWGEHGTWRRPPLLIDRRLLDPSDSGLQVLGGARASASYAAAYARTCTTHPKHQAWVGRPWGERPATFEHPAMPGHAPGARRCTVGRDLLFGSPGPPPTAGEM